MKSNFYSILFLLIGAFSFAQVGINTTTPDPSSMLDISSSNKGVLIPRVALTGTLDTTTITTGNVNSLLVFNTATAGVGVNTVTPGYYYWYNNKWNRISEKISTLTQYDWNMVYVDEANNTTVFPVSLYGFGNPNLLGIPGDVGALFLDGDNGYVYNFNVSTNSWTMVSHHQGNGNPNTLGIVGSAGEVYVDQLTGQMYGHNGATWISQASSETITTLEQGIGTEAGKYTYTSENNTETQLNIPQIDRFEPNSNGILGQEGDIYVNSSNGDLYTFNGTTGLWELQGAPETVTTLIQTGNPGVYLYTSENNTQTSINIYQKGWGDPNALSVAGLAGCLYVNNQNGNVFTHNGTTWVLSNVTADTITTLVQGPGASAGTYTYTNEAGTQVPFKVYRVGSIDPNSTFPILPGVAGDIYVNSTNGDLYTFNGTTWILQVQPTPEPWYNAATNTVATSNTQNIYQSGNVGIGSNQAPLYTLDVSAGVNSGKIRQTSSGAGYSATDGLVHDYNGVNYNLINYENGYTALFNDGSPKFQINAGGNTAIRENLVVGLDFSGTSDISRTSNIENAALSEVTVLGTGSGNTASSVDIVRDVSTGSAGVTGTIIGSLKFISKSSTSSLDSSNKITGAKINALNTGLVWSTLTPSVALSFEVMNTGILKEALRIKENGNIGINTNNPRTSLDIATTDGVILPSGTNAQRPAAPVFGTIRYNSTIGRFEGYVNDVDGNGVLGDAGWRAF